MEHTVKELKASLNYTKESLAADAAKITKYVQEGKYQFIEQATKSLNGYVELAKILEKDLEAAEKIERAAARAKATGWAVVEAFVEEMLEKDGEWLKECIDLYRNDYQGFKKAGFNKTTQDLIRRGFAGGMEILTQDAEYRKLDLKAKVEKKVGPVTNAQLNRNENGGFDGRVTGTDGAVYIQTIVAGGYNIQRAHYRTLVK